MKMGGFYAHSPKTGGLALLKPLGPSGLPARFCEVGSPTKEAAKLAPAGAIEQEAVALDKTGRTKGEVAKVHIGFRLAADVVESLKASGAGYNARVERILQEALDKGRL